MCAFNLLIFCTMRVRRENTCSSALPSQGFIALHTGMLPVLNVIHVQAAAGCEIAPTVQVGHIQIVIFKPLQRANRSQKYSRITPITVCMQQVYDVSSALKEGLILVSCSWEDSHAAAER